MKKSTMTAVLGSDIQKVWDVVTDNENCAWRSDIIALFLLSSSKTLDK
jgi:hypothetical protein